MGFTGGRESPTQPMSITLRGADVVARSLHRIGCRRVFTLSGNHIMSIFDAALDAGLDLVHVRHEAAAVHMADAHGRLTGEAGVALVTGGPGHANAVGALYTALAAESPMVLLSGHAATWEIGRGGFQELRQSEMAKPVTKASWTVGKVETLGRDIGEAFRIALSGRRGPVHLSLPTDVLEARLDESAVTWPTIGAPACATLGDADYAKILSFLAAAKHPIILAGPQMSSPHGRDLLADVEAATGAPAIILESPRGLADATLGALADLVKRVDLVVLLGKALDFSLKWLAAPTFDPSVQVISIDPEAELTARAKREKSDALIFACVADPAAAAEKLAAGARPTALRDTAWFAEARRALDARPASWSDVVSKTPGRLHPAEVFRILRPFLERDPGAILVCDGGEYAQWGQSMLPVRRRLVNGVAGSIGSSLSFALAARLVEKKAPVFAVLGDGTIGFHIAEFETAVRRALPFVAVVGNDARWNAESEIQRREYGANRMHGCELLPVRYDEVAKALGGHGEYVERAADLAAAIDRALVSGKPACVNVMIESVAAPALRLPL
jgi:thiamine pyrophosphate-dependent acetolactate synthase large subunit-like protein